VFGFLCGRLLSKHPPVLVLDVQGIGYEVEAPMTTFYDLPDTGADVTLFTHLVVRDDAHLLFGFIRQDQRDLFRQLLRVNGVGPRMGLAILSGLTQDEFMDCVARDDVARLTRVPGVGRKTAERLVIELRDRAVRETEIRNAAGHVRADAVGEAVSALIALGYRPPEASRAVRAVAGEGMVAEEIIRAALRSVTGMER